jgi:hypothetical protein
MSLEARTVAAMIRIYCRAHHGGSGTLCEGCAHLLTYADERIEKCPFGTAKPACNTCTVHCYQPDEREQIREVMRYAGPRMLWRHPFLAVRHLVQAMTPVKTQH